MAKDIYARISRPPRTSADRSVPVMIMTVVLLSIVPVSLFVFSIRYSLQYRDYMNSLTNSFTSSETASRFTGSVSVEGEPVQIDSTRASELFFEINQAGMGRTCRKKTDESGIEILFIDGAALQITDTVMKIENGETEEGVTVDYMYPDGRRYIYETVQLRYIALRKLLTGHW